MHPAPPEYPVAPQRWNGLAIAGFACGVISLFTSYAGLLLLVAGLVLSIMGLRRIKVTGERGRGLAITGIVLSLLSVILLLLVILLGLGAGLISVLSS